MTLEERGRHYNPEQVNAFVPPEIADIRKYFAEVRTQTLEYVKGLEPEDYNREITTPRGTNTVSGFLTNIINHAAQHTGEMSYVRGLKRGLNQ